MKIYDGMDGLNGDGKEVQILGPKGENVKAIHIDLKGKRTEVVETGGDKYIKKGEESWVSYYFKLPDNYSGFASFGTLGYQSHTRVSAKESPIFTIRWGSRGLTLEANGAEDIQLDQFKGGIWYHVIIKQIFDTKNGLIEIWINDGNEIAYYIMRSPGGNLSSKSIDGDEAGYHKWGLYASQGSSGEMWLYGIKTSTGKDQYEFHAGAVLPPDDSDDDDNPNDDDSDPVDPIDPIDFGDGAAIINEFLPFKLDIDIEFKTSGSNVDAIEYIPETDHTNGWIAITGKNNDRVTIHDISGEEIVNFEVEGVNGIVFFEGKLFATRREGSRIIRVYDAYNFDHIGEFGGKPDLTDGEHDITVMRTKNDIPLAWVTDDSGKVVCYNLTSLQPEYKIKTGIPDGKGLEEIEAISMANADFDWLVIADENLSTGNVFEAWKIWPDGSAEYFKSYGKGINKSDSEGLTHIAAGDGKTGYLISTDQQGKTSIFHIWRYSPEGFAHCGGFELEGVSNTDGNNIGGGYFFAIDDDDRGVGVKLSKIFEAAGLGFEGEPSDGGNDDNDPGDDNDAPDLDKIWEEIEEVLDAQKAKIKNILLG